MYLPGPVRSARDYLKRRKLLSDGLAATRGKSDALGPVRYAIKRALRGPSREERQHWNTIERRRQRIANSNELVCIDNQQIRLSDHGLASSSDRPWTDFIFQLVRVVRPSGAIELGTNIGMSGSYIANAMALNGAGHLWTHEKFPDLVRVARDTFKETGVGEKVSVVPGLFSDTLDQTLKNGPFTFGFIDGHHDGDATIEYYEKIKPTLGAGSILVFDDISWSRSMQSAWKTISDDKIVRDACEVMGWGIVSIW